MIIRFIYGIQVSETDNSTLKIVRGRKQKLCNAIHINTGLGGGGAAHRNAM